MSAASSPLSDPPPSPNPIEVRKISPARKSVGDVQMNTEAPHRSGHVDRTDSEHQTAARSSHRPPNKRRRTRSASIAEQGDSRAERESAAGQSHNTGREYERPDYGPPTPTSAGIPPGTDGRGRFSRDDFTGHLYPDYWPRPPQPRDWAAGSARPRPPPPAAIDAIKAQKGKRRNSGSGSAIEPPTPMSASAKGSSRAAEESTEIGASRGRVSSSSSEQMASSKQAARQRSGKEQSTSRRPSGNLAQPVKAVNGKEEASSEVDELADDGERSEWDEATDDESVPLAMLARSRKAASSGRAGLQEAVVAMSRDLAASKAVRDKGQSSAGNPVERASGTEPRPHRGPSNEGNQPDEGKAGEMSASRRVPVQELEISQSEGSPVGASSQQQGEPSSGWHDGRRPSGEAPSPVLNIGKDERMRKYEEDRRKYEEDRQRIRSGRATTDLDVSGQSAAQSIDPSRKRQVSGSGNEQLAKSTQPSPVSSRRPDHARDEMQQRRQVVEQRGSRHNSPRLPPRDPKSGRDPGCDLTLEEVDKFLDLIEKHNPETLNDEEMARSVTALYQDWLVWCASRLTVPKPKSALMAEFVNVHNGKYGPASQRRAIAIVQGSENLAKAQGKAVAYSASPANAPPGPSPQGRPAAPAPGHASASASASAHAHPQAPPSVSGPAPTAGSAASAPAHNQASALRYTVGAASANPPPSTIRHEPVQLRRPPPAQAPMAEPGRVYTGAAMPVSARTSQAPSRTASNGYPQTKALSPGQDQLWPAPAEGKRLKPRPEPVAILPAQSSRTGLSGPPRSANVTSAQAPSGPDEMPHSASASSMPSSARRAALEERPHSATAVSMPTSSRAARFPDEPPHSATPSHANSSRFADEPPRNQGTASLAQVGRNGLAVLPPGLFDILRTHLRDELLQDVLPLIRTEVAEQTRDLVQQNTSLMSRVQQLEQHVHSHNLWLQHLARQQEEPSQPLPRHERLPTSTYLPEHSAASAPPTERRSHHRSPSPYAAHPVYSSSTRSPPEARGARWSAAATIEVTSSRSLPYSTRTPTMAEYDRPPPRTERSERALNSPPPPLPSRTTVRPSYGGLEPLPHTEGHPHTPSYAYDSDDRATYRSAYQPEEWHRSVSRLQDLDNPRPSKRHRASMDEEHLGAGMPASAEYTRSDPYGYSRETAAGYR